MGRGTEFARVGVDEWTPAPYAELVSLVTALDEPASAGLRASAGHLLRAHPIVPAEEDSIELASYLLLLLSIAGHLSEAERLSFTVLLESILESDVSPRLYAEALAAVRVAFQSNHSPYVCDWIVEVLQIRAICPVRQSK